MKKSVRVLFIAVCCIAMPVMVMAWSLSTRVGSGGGTLQVRTDTPQTSTNGTIFKNYTTHKNVPVTLTATANPGYKFSNIQVNGSYVTPVPSTSLQVYQMGLAQYPALTSQSIMVTFTPLMTTMTVNAGTAGGSVYPYGALSRQVGTVTSFAFTPNTGSQVIAITGLPTSGYTLSPAVLPAPVNTKVTLTLTAPATPLTVTGIFRGVVAKTGVPQYAWTDTIVTLDGTGSTINAGGGSLAYVWAWNKDINQVGTFSGSNTSQPTFTTSVVGIYRFQLTVSNGTYSDTAYTNVIVTNTPAATARGACQSCHQSVGIGSLHNVFGNWSSSTHKQKLVMCAMCHIGADTGGHPGNLSRTTVNPTTFKVIFPIFGLNKDDNFCSMCHGSTIVADFNVSPHNSHGVLCSSCHINGSHNPDVSASACNGCHLDSNGNVSGHPFAVDSSPCVACHNPHSTAGSAPNITAAHFNTMTSAGYPASYVTSRSSCSDCHYYSSANLNIRKEWAQSAHAATTDASWKYYDFKTMSGCVQCHTTTGFIAYSAARVTTAWGTGSDKTKELLTCVGCHSDITTGAVRAVTPIHPYTADPGYLNPNIGKSNICMTCHSGMKNGKSITVQLDALADFTNLPFIDPHFMAAGGTSYGQAGYHFPGRNYNPEATHTRIGATDGIGPCVSCHKNSTNGHKFQSGALPLCSSCHGSTLDAASIGADKISLLSAVEVLRAQLAAKGFVSASSPPSFSNTNWGTGQAGANTMGAAFNYVLLATEPGVYAHNPVYARQLVLDSIDYLDNAQFDDSVSTLAVPNLLASGAISQVIADSMNTYKSKNACTICHGGTAATAAPMATNAHGSHLTGNYGPGFYLGSDLGSCQACHQYGSATHLNGSVDLAGSACAGCHPGATPVWNISSRISCTVCHAPNPSVLPNGVTAPYKGNFDTKGHGRYSASNQCTLCHDPDSRHISGSLGSYTRLRLLNDNNLCASCHNNAAVVGAAFRNMSTHFTTKGGDQTMACDACHDPHGTTNLSMIRTTINGTTIAYTDRSTGLVNSSTNRGLCQVCHTLTAHYRAGVPETGHPTTDCLGCHPHNAAGGAFKPFGSCDACHGYPPAPRRATPAFGTMNNWSGARFEDYSGGGGAHLVAAHVPKNASPSAGWANCIQCHNGGAANHAMKLPVKEHAANVSVLVDPQYSFTPGTLPVFDATTRTCSNVSCHSVKAGTFSYYFQGGDGEPELNTVSYGGVAQQTPAWSATGALCIACHGNPPAHYAWHSGKHGNQVISGPLNQCQFCHTDATGANGHGTAITNATLHRNDVADVQATFKSSCFGCH